VNRPIWRQSIKVKSEKLKKTPLVQEHTWAIDFTPRNQSVKKIPQDKFIFKLLLLQRESVDIKLEKEEKVKVTNVVGSSSWEM
jgi:hypothetical protein